MAENINTNAIAINELEDGDKVLAIRNSDGALVQVPLPADIAANITISDAGELIVATNVEDALQELASDPGAINFVQQATPPSGDSGLIWFDTGATPTSVAYEDLSGLPTLGVLASKNVVAVPGDITATGTPDATTVLHGDGSWAVPAGGGGSSGIGETRIYDWDLSDPANVPVDQLPVNGFHGNGIIVSYPSTAPPGPVTSGVYQNVQRWEPYLLGLQDIAADLPYGTLFEWSLGFFYSTGYEGSPDPNWISWNTTLFQPSTFADGSTTGLYMKTRGFYSVPAPIIPQFSRYVSHLLWSDENTIARASGTFPGVTDPLNPANSLRFSINLPLIFPQNSFTIEYGEANLKVFIP